MLYGRKGLEVLLMLEVQLSSIGIRLKCYVSDRCPLVPYTSDAKPGFLLILLSTTIYTPAHLLPSTPNLPLSHLTHFLERRLVLSLLCSFLNTSLAPTKPPGIGSTLPYNHLISKSAEERRTLVRGCMMVLLVALDYREISMGSTGEMGEVKDENAFRYFISKLVSSVEGYDSSGADLTGS
jgi:hypothetical protein